MPEAKSLLKPGDPAPWFAAVSPEKTIFRLDAQAGRYVVLSFFRSAGHDATQQFLREVFAQETLFDHDQFVFVGISIDRQDEAQGRLKDRSRGLRFAYDFDRVASKAYGAAMLDDSPLSQNLYRPMTLVLDERLRVITTLLFDESKVAEHLQQLWEVLDGLPPLPPETLVTSTAPVLIVPRVFEPALCRELIDYYEALGGVESGFMREIQGKTVEVFDPGHKRRKDQEIQDESLRQRAMFAVHDRVMPEIQKAFQFRPTRIERHIVACYDANDGGHFRAHRDNTTKGTAHRRFAVSLNLNTGEYEGGRLRFPEFGRQQYEAPAGGAVVFSCSLLHEATRVTRGRRYAYLPFLYDEAAARIREANLKYLANQPE
jgi:peroxiredoxin/predicted 2-oxoglutarate/Fe(II)-dependent dioxygenase YbiX